MAAITWADVTAVASELASTNVTAQGFYLDFVNSDLNPLNFGGEESPRLRLARIHLAAHMATLDRLRGSSIAGPVISESRGGLSRSYANLFTLAGGPGMWGTTAYGQVFEALIRSSPRARFPTVA